MGKLKAALNRKLGPLPVWAYAGILIVLAFVYRKYKANKAASDPSVLAPAPVDTTGNLLPDNSLPADNSGNGATDSSLDPNATLLAQSIKDLYDLISSGGIVAPNDPVNPDTPGSPPKAPKKEPAPEGSHPDYGATHPPPNNKPGFWWNMSGTETWVTADMKSRWLAYLRSTGTDPGVWARNHPPAAKIMGIAPSGPENSHLPDHKKTSLSVSTAPIKDRFGRTSRPANPTGGTVRRGVHTVGSGQGSDPGAGHSLAMLPPIEKVSSGGRGGV